MVPSGLTTIKHRRAQATLPDHETINSNLLLTLKGFRSYLLRIWSNNLGVGKGRLRPPARGSVNLSRDCMLK